MNNLRAGVVLSSILVANCAATAKYEKKSAEVPAVAEDAKPFPEYLVSSSSHQLCD